MPITLTVLQAECFSVIVPMFEYFSNDIFSLWHSKLLALSIKHAVISFHLWAIVSFWFQMTLE